MTGLSNRPAIEEGTGGDAANDRGRYIIARTVEAGAPQCGSVQRRDSGRDDSCPLGAAELIIFRHPCEETFVKIAVQLQPASGVSQQQVEYRWDPDTDILSAQLSPGASGNGMSGSV